MRTLRLEYPKLSVTVSVPDDMAASFERNFAHALSVSLPTTAHLHFDVRPQIDGVSVLRNRLLSGTFPNATEVMFAIEEDLEFALIERLDGWIGFHAGAVTLGDVAIVTLGHPDTGKTTTTLQLAELGLPMLCEEVTPVDPDTRLVHSFPHPLTLARGYGEAFAARYPVTRGDLSFYGADMARYAPHAVRVQPAQLGVMLFPAYNPSSTPAIERLSPADVIPDVFGYCFTPTRGDEHLYDSVIRVVEQCRLFRLHTCSIESARTLLIQLIADLSAPPM